MLFKMRSAYFAAVISSVLTVAAVASAKYAVQSPKIQVHAKGPAGMSIDGVSNTLKIEEDDNNLKFRTFLNTIDTKNAKRNDHMQDRLEAKKHGAIVLSVAKNAVDPKKNATVPGKLTFHGIEKDVQVKYEVTGGKHVHATFGFDVTKHGVKEEDLCFEPKTKSICAKTHVDVEVDFDFDKKD
ncbi:MAG TPA: YceI family protein [Polyangiaceae bacterium]|nr:YceI family protein [Polyangiaceae bacterium]